MSRARFVDLADFAREEVIELLALATRLQQHPEPRALAGRILGLLFLNPSLRTLASFQAAMARLGGSSFVITPGQGSWALETRNGVVMDGAAAEHAREGLPVLAAYCDALGIRAFADGRDLAADLADANFAALAALVDKPVINLESAINHPCQALADWKTLDDLAVAPHAKFVLAWVTHPRALPLAVPAAITHMAALRGHEVVVLRPPGFALPDAVLARARAAAARSGGSVVETEDRAAALAGATVLYAKEWGATEQYGDAARDAQLRAPLGGWQVRESWFAAAERGCHFMHCLPVRRNVAVADEVLDGPRSQVLRAAHNRLVTQMAVLHRLLAGASAASTRATTDPRPVMSYRPEQAVAIRAMRNAAPYIRMYKGKVFVVKVGGNVFANPAATRSLVEQVGILHQVGIRVVLVHGGGPQLDEMQRALGREPQMVDGRRVTDEQTAEATVMVLNGLLNTRLLGICRELGIRAVGLSGVAGGLVAAHRRPPVRSASGAIVDYGLVGDLERIDPDVIRTLLDGGYMPVVSPVSCDARGAVLNINADSVAAGIGAALGAEKLLLCTGAAGIFEQLDDPSTLVSYTDLAGLERLTAGGSFADGMLPKAGAIEAAIRGGVRRVHVISFKSPDALLAEVFTNEGLGTLIVADIQALSAAEQQPDGSAP